ncbi:glycosyltransferase [Nakamurella endophytica]|uniref:Glycosyl transferase n=1 Tax=Nakamurella endophytica TaxID=1748367 RepID=A0A917WI54_9ACTN|nr:glycosyltransferase [Nakamurella endophytica]GGM08164.1 glycosyl transferase [Nakamurella endophytica]
MKILAWHVHGSWMTSFVQGPDSYLLPVLPDRGPDGVGRARTWDWPASVTELPPEQLRDADVDVVLLQRQHEIELVERWTGRRPGRDVPAVYVEHDAPRGGPVDSRHPLADRTDIPVVHVTHWNREMWDNGVAPTSVVDHGIVDPGPLYSGERDGLAVAVNEPVRRTRVAGTDLVVWMADRVPVDVYGMGTDLLAAQAPALAGRVHNLSQDELHHEMARHRAYLHPYRWTSLGLSLLEAMTIGMPVAVFAGTAAPEAVPRDAGVVSADREVLLAAARRWLADPDEAREVGAAARRHALAHFGLQRFLSDWQHVLTEVVR